MGTARHTDATRNRAAELWLAGATTSEIGEDCGVSDRTVRTWLTGADVGYSHSESARRRHARERAFRAQLDKIAAGPDGQLTGVELDELAARRRALRCRGQLTA